MESVNLSSLENYAKVSAKRVAVNKMVCVKMGSQPRSITMYFQGDVGKNKNKLLQHTLERKPSMDDSDWAHIVNNVKTLHVLHDANNPYTESPTIVYLSKDSWTFEIQFDKLGFTHPLNDACLLLDVAHKAYNLKY